MTKLDEVIDLCWDDKIVTGNLLEDAEDELRELRELLRECLPYVEDMIGIASSARPLKHDIEEYLLKV